MTKRPQAPSSQSLPSSSAPAPRPAKRTRRSPPPPPAALSSSSQPEPSTLISQNPSHPSQPQPHPHPVPSTSRLPPPSSLDLPKPSKRSIVPGSLRRLSSGHPVASRSPLTDGGLVREKQTLAGAKVGGKSKDLKDGANREELWVKRSATGAGKGKGKDRAGGQGLGFSGYLKKGVGAFVDRGCTSLLISGMGAAIPLALSLALAIRDAIPGGEPAVLPGGVAEEGKVAGGDELVSMTVKTGSQVVKDEVTPDDEDDDMHYQSRTKSTVSIELRLVEPLASSLGQAGPRIGGGKGGGRGGTSGRGRKRRGGKA